MIKLNVEDFISSPDGEGIHDSSPPTLSNDNTDDEYSDTSYVDKVISKKSIILRDDQRHDANICV